MLSILRLQSIKKSKKIDEFCDFFRLGASKKKITAVFILDLET